MDETSITFFNSQVSPRACELVSDVLRSGWLSEGARVKEFEGALTERLGLVNPVALNSGTSALHLALAVAGVGPGDEVILPPQTFVATGLAILMQGATPVFADINPNTGNICPLSIASRITERTKAIIPVHWAGYPCDMDEIAAIAQANGLAVIEDAAHALGATYRGRPIGSLSRFTAFSFQAIKHLTTGDGGALCCRSPVDAARARARRWFGIDRANSQPSILGERIFDITEVGYKYHMNDLAAAIGLGNLEDFPARLSRRQTIAREYRRELQGVAGIRLLECNPDRVSASWLFTMLVEDREGFIRKLRDSFIPVSVVHLRIDRYSVFGGVRGDLSNQTTFDSHQASIPVHEALTETVVERIVRTIHQGW
jgi:perosamine synthetase